MVAGREQCHEEATRTAPVPAEPHGPRRCGGPEHSVGLSIDSQEFFARFLRVGGLAAQPHRSSENACVGRLTEPPTKSTWKVCRSLRRFTGRARACAVQRRLGATTQELAYGFDELAD